MKLNGYLEVNQDLFFSLMNSANIDSQSDECLELFDMILNLSEKNKTLLVVFDLKIVELGILDLFLNDINTFYNAYHYNDIEVLFMQSNESTKKTLI